MNLTHALNDGEVHVWPISLSVAPEERLRLLESLSQEERTRANGFSLPHLKERYIAGRGMVRGIVARYLGCPPAEIEFAYTAYGKPFLRDETKHGLRF
ncbi:MAG TPA: hypothetical protein VKS79_07050, partial [Gemmataceae bacterium]|nr:hypothetical protein [Gemmataceae bacterium]